jgi:hypothetical protein
MNGFILFITVISLLVLQACCLEPKEGHYPIKNGLIEWIPYKESDTVIFKNDSSEYDTLVVSRFFEGTEEMNGTECGDWTGDIKSISLSSLNDTLFHLSTYVEDHYFSISAPSGSIKWNDNSYTIEAGAIGSVYRKSLGIDGVEYQRVFHLKDQGPTFYPAQVTEVFYVWGMGLIKYSRSDSTVWRKKL